MEITVKNGTKHATQNKVITISTPTGVRSLLAIGFLFISTPLSVLQYADNQNREFSGFFLLTMALTVSKVIRQTTDWKKEAAELIP